MFTGKKWVQSSTGEISKYFISSSTPSNRRSQIISLSEICSACDDLIKRTACLNQHLFLENVALRSMWSSLNNLHSPKILQNENGCLKLRPPCSFRTRYRHDIDICHPLKIIYQQVNRFSHHILEALKKCSHVLKWAGEETFVRLKCVYPWKLHES